MTTQTSVTLEYADITDRPELARSALVAAEPQLPADVGFLRSVITARSESTGYRLLAAFDGRGVEAIGIVGYHRELSHEHGRHLRIDHLAVISDAERDDIESGLLAEVLARAISAAITTVLTDIATPRHPDRSPHLTLGFNPTTTTMIWNDPRANAEPAYRGPG